MKRQIESFYLPLVLTVALSTFAASSTVSINSNGGTPLRDSQGNLLSGFAIRVGKVDLSGVGLQIAQYSSEESRLLPRWTVLAEGTQGGGQVVQNGNSGTILKVNDQFTVGHVFGQITNTSSLPSGTPLVIWVFNHQDPSLATEWGIFSSTETSWQMPSALGSTTLNTSQIDTIIRGTDIGTELRLAPKNTLSFDGWLVSQFDDTELATPEISGDNSDSDADRWPNLAEYVFGMNPSLPDQPGARFTFLAESRELQWQPQTDTNDVQILGRYSTNLTSWFPAVTTESSLGTFRTQLPAGSKYFAQLIFSRN
ncbi:MAG: hypothetical protein ACSHYB_12840 [Roseibacillus sp.]